ncbi:hamartin [Onthophagus taurus]|uniref:hamartin n=1 Tax=Onthophagus taurus TaxID=166361 RepID=UPI000C201C21|nr:hamartin [Onthophagus taurus]
MVDLMQNLESNDPKLVEDSKRLLHEQFSSVKEPWLVYGLYDFYLQSNSTRLIEVLVDLKEPHHTFLFDKLTESLKGTKDSIKFQGLTLLGHVVRSRPTWIYKITQHSLMKDLLRLLKTEPDILILLSALMPLIVLLPIVPSLMGDYLREVFDVFCRLAGLNFTESAKLIEDQMVHMQVALYALFLRLYGMYPCNFLAYLRDQHRNKSLTPIFTHTIKPMLDTVRMHPHLVTTSKQTETSIERWKTMGAEDVIIECEKFSLDLPDRCSHESCFMSSFRSRSSTNSATHESSNQLQMLRNINSNQSISDNNFFSPSMILHCSTPPVTEIPIPFSQNIPTTIISSISHMSQESSSPPEAAIEATPETTPIRDTRVGHRTHPQNPLTIISHTFTQKTKLPTSSGHNTPANSQPSSPMRKEGAQFNFDKHSSAFGLPRRDQLIGNRLQKLVQERQAGTVDLELRRLPPTSPVKIPLESHNFNTISSMESAPFSQEDEEVSQIVRDGGSNDYPGWRQCDSVVHEVEERADENLDNNCEQEHGSPCTEGGLHMPNSKSINDFTKRIQRLRYSSQCADDAEKYELSTGSSPGNAVSYPNNQVRRTNSCPEMKKSPVVPANKDNINKTLIETDEDTNGDYQDGKPSLSNGLDVDNDKLKNKVTSETQTESIWPMPYEHLFLSIFPTLESNEIKASPGTLITRHDRPNSCNTYDITDRYNDICIKTYEKESLEYFKNQIELLKQQLHFEKHRREMHACKNRRLLADAKNTRALEEHKAALKDQVQIKQKDIDNLTEEMEDLKRKHISKEKDAQYNVTFWEQKFKSLSLVHSKLKEEHEELEKKLISTKDQLIAIDLKWQSAESDLISTMTEVKIAKEQAEAGERGRLELDRLNRELLLLGELQLKYQERMNDAALLKRSDVELIKLTEAYKYEIQGYNNQLETKQNQLDACKARILDLEHKVQRHDDTTISHKKQLNDVKEACNTKIKAVESKYQTQLAINRALEDKIVELRSQIEVTTKKVISPDTSSCHEVNPSLMDQTSAAQGLSTHSSPLSASLTSSDGSSAFTSEPKDLKNLHKIVDQKDENNE